MGSTVGFAVGWFVGVVGASVGLGVGFCVGEEAQLPMHVLCTNCKEDIQRQPEILANSSGRLSSMSIV